MELYGVVKIEVGGASPPSPGDRLPDIGPGRATAQPLTGEKIMSYSGLYGVLKQVSLKEKSSEFTAVAMRTFEKLLRVHLLPVPH